MAAVYRVTLGKVLAAVNNGDALLHYAAQIGYLHIIQLLREWGVDVNIKTRITEATPLLTVVSHNLDADLTEKTVDMLIHCGARTSEKNGAGDSPLFMAIRRRQYRVFKQLLSKVENPTMLVDKDGNTILHTAAQVNAIEICRKIMENDDMKKMVAEQNKDGQTPIHLAAKHNYLCMEAIVSALRLGENYSALVEWFSALDSNGCTPLDIAAKARQEATFKFMWDEMKNYSPAHIVVECRKLKTLIKNAKDDPSQWQKLSDALSIFPKRM